MDAKTLVNGRNPGELKADHLSRVETTRLRRENKRLLEEAITAEKRLKFVLALNGRKSRSYKIPASRGLHSEAVSHMILSDIHFEERIRRETTNGLNEYDLTIAKKSVANFFANGLKLHQIAAKDIPIRTIVLAWLGDMINGYIHEEYQEENQLSPVEAAMELEDVLASGLRYLLANADVDRIIVPCCHGNHGRTTLKLRISTMAKNSYEWWLYHHVAYQFRNEPRVQFIIEPGYLTYITLFDKYDIRYHHGHAIRYEGGVGGMTIPANKAIARWDRERKAYLDVFGHHHGLLLDPGKFVVNGSLCGYNPFGVFKSYPYEEPKQAFFLIDRERGKTISAPIFVR